MKGFRKKVMLLFAAIITSGALAQQVEQPFENKGFNIFLDDEFNVGDFVSEGIAFTAGWQISPRVFVGAGTSFNSFLSESFNDCFDTDFLEFDQSVFLPLYACTKINFTDKKVSPFFDLRLGGDLTSAFSLYGSASVGCRIGLGIGDFALVPSLGYTYLYDNAARASHADEWDYHYAVKDYYNLFCVRIGVEF